MSINIGTQFQRPSISKQLKPGGWYPLANNSPFLLHATEAALNNIKLSGLNYTNLTIKIITAATQVTNGVNVYLEFQINRSVPLYVQAIVYTPVSSPQVKLSNLYVTTTNIFDNS
jgi:hypothetical protein